MLTANFIWKMIKWKTKRYQVQVWWDHDGLIQINTENEHGFQYIIQRTVFNTWREGWISESSLDKNLKQQYSTKLRALLCTVSGTSVSKIFFIFFPVNPLILHILFPKSQIIVSVSVCRHKCQQEVQKKRPLLREFPGFRFLLIFN
jgi:hypothetical protein